MALATDKKKAKTESKVEELEVKLPSGVVLRGPRTTVLDAARALGVKETDLFPIEEWYHSTSKGFIRLKEMDTNHLKNVSRLRLNEYIDAMVAKHTVGSAYTEAIIKWADVDDFPGLLAVLKELRSRTA